MSENKFLVFNEDVNEVQTMNDIEYTSASQRKKGVGSGVADRRLHNKLYRQTSMMAHALGEFVKSQGLEATDANASALSENVKNALDTLIDEKVQTHNERSDAHALVISQMNDLLNHHKSDNILDHPDGCVTGAKIQNGAVTVDKLADVGEAGSYAFVTVNSKGLVTSGGNTITEDVTFDGAALAKTMSKGDNSNHVATTAFVNTALSDFGGEVDKKIKNASKIQLWRY